nr:MAG TPA: hypothetical protein [Caudoviricetes sp.]
MIFDSIHKRSTTIDSQKLRSMRRQHYSSRLFRMMVMYRFCISFRLK